MKKALLFSIIILTTGCSFLEKTYCYIGCTNSEYPYNLCTKIFCQKKDVDNIIRCNYIKRIEDARGVCNQLID